MYRGEEKPLTVANKIGKNFRVKLLNKGNRLKMSVSADGTYEELQHFNKVGSPFSIPKAARPFNSRLDKSKLTANGFALLPTWQNALNRYLKDLKTQE